MEKATEQLSGRVTQSQKDYFAGIEGSFSEKVAMLIELHKNRVENDIFTISPNMDAINKAISTIIKNVEVVEMNANNYVEDYNNKIASQIAILESDSIELRNISEEYSKLEKVNELILKEHEELQLKLENLKKTIENKDLKINELVEKNNELLNDKLNNQDHIEKIKENYKAKVEDLISEYNAKISKLGEEIHLKEININELDKKVSIESGKADSLKDKVEELKAEIKEIKASNKDDIKVMNEKVDSLVEQLGKEKLIKQKIEIELNNKIESMDKVIADKDSTIAGLIEELSKFKESQGIDEE